MDTIKAIKASAPTGYTTDVWGFNLQGIIFAAWNAYNTTHINIGKKSNLPSLKDRYGTPWGERIANPDLKPESAINYEIGHSFDYDATHLSAVAFFNHLSNMFVIKESYTGCTSPSNNNRGCTKLENVDQGYSYGVELALSQGLFDDKLTLGANYTYTDQYVDYESNGRGDREHYNRILYYPKHIANAQIIFTPIQSLDFIANASYKSHSWLYSGGSYDKNNDIFLIDLKLNYRPVQNLQLSLGAYNLLDRDYYYSGVRTASLSTGRYYQPGRRILAGVEYRF